MMWWGWLLMGLVLLAAEVMAPGGFYLLFLGLAALVLGALIGVGPEVPLWLQWVLFSGLSIASLLLFRGPLLARMKTPGHKGGEMDSLVGETAMLLEDLAPGMIGKAELRGSSWTVRNAGPAPLAKGHRARVKKVEGLTLWVSSD